MKKLIFILLAVCSVTLVSRLWQSYPVEPKIIGTGNLQYVAEHNLWFVVIDSTQYNISRVFDAQDVSTPITPVDGMPITVYTSNRNNDVEAMTGKMSAAQIEEVYSAKLGDGTVLEAYLGLLIGCVAIMVGVSWYQSRKRK